MYQQELKEKWYEFGPFQLRLPERLLVRTQDGQAVSLTPKAIETLRVLVERSPHVVEKDDLLKEVWSESIVEEATLAQNIFTLRKVLAEHDIESTVSEPQSYIATVPKRGYRFSAPVRVVSPEPGEHGHPVNQFLKPTQTLRQIDPVEKQIEESVNSPTQEPTGEAVLADLKSDSQQGPEQTTNVGKNKRAQTRVYLLTLASITVLIILGGLLYLRMSDNNHPAPIRRVPFQSMNVTSLNTSERIVQAAISPDGKYIAHAVEDGGKQSLCVRQVVAANTICIIPPAEVFYLGLTFSHDGNYIYYVANDLNVEVWTLHRIPVFGGPVEKLISDVDSAVSLSPDSEQLAFIRYRPQTGEASLMVARKDGANERKLISYKHHDYFPIVSPAWSPDGKSIAFASQGLQENDALMNIALISLANNQVTPIDKKQWINIEGLCWLSDGSGLLVTARDESRLAQIWHLAYPSGDVARVTNDLNFYHGLSLTKDAKTLVTIQYDNLSSLWVSSPGKEAEAVQLTTGKFDGFNGITWTPDQKILYTVRNGSALDIWEMSSDGKNKHQLTDAKGLSHSPAVSPDGRTIVYVLNRNGVPNLWLMNRDGKNNRQLTFGYGERTPSFTPDGRWIVYSNVGEGRTTIWKVSVDGGQPRQLTNKYSRSPVVSPSEQFFACYYWDEQPDLKSVMAVVPLTGGTPSKTFDLPTEQVVWSPDGRGLTYVNGREKISNIWSQPLDGGAPKKLTNFTVNQIFNFSWSRDGKQLAYASGASSYDLVMFTQTP